MRWIAVLAACMGFAAVALGALASHALALDAAAHARFDTALLFHCVHVPAALLAVRDRAAGAAALAAGVAFLAGIVLFCGSLYARSLGAPAAVESAAPFGGVAFMFGWAALAVAEWHRARGAAP
jgi:uncharacterized membrane protein YgdD (TMEM256/DUF423 family)